MSAPNPARPTAEAIISAVIQTMEQGVEPYIKNKMAVAPHCFRIHLHPEAYKDLAGQFPRIKMVMERQLGSTLQNMKRVGFGTFGEKIMEWLRVEVFKKPPTQREVSVMGKWEIGFVESFDDIPLNYLGVEASFASIGEKWAGSQDVAGHKTVGYTFMTQGLSASMTADAIAPTGTKKAPLADAVRAVLSWKDPETQTLQTYPMTTDALAIGRNGAADAEYAYLPVLRLHHVPVEISRVHAYIRYDSSGHTFLFQNVGQHGTSVMPAPIAKSGTDWFYLPKTCTLCLGNKLFVSFKAKI